MDDEVRNNTKKAIMSFISNPIENIIISLKYKRIKKQIKKHPGATTWNKRLVLYEFYDAFYDDDSYYLRYLHNKLLKYINNNYLYKISKKEHRKRLIKIFILFNFPIDKFPKETEFLIKKFPDLLELSKIYNDLIKDVYYSDELLCSLLSASTQDDWEHVLDEFKNLLKKEERRNISLLFQFLAECAEFNILNESLWKDIVKILHIKNFRHEDYKDYILNISHLYNNNKAIWNDIVEFMQKTKCPSIIANTLVNQLEIKNGKEFQDILEVLLELENTLFINVNDIIEFNKIIQNKSIKNIKELKELVFKITREYNTKNFNVFKLRKEGYYCCHVTNAFAGGCAGGRTYKKKPFLNIVLPILINIKPEQMKEALKELKKIGLKIKIDIINTIQKNYSRTSPSASIIGPKIKQTVVELSQGGINGSIGVIFSYGYIYKSYTGDASTYDLITSAGNHIRTSTNEVSKDINYILNFAGQRDDYNEVLLRKWIVSEIFFTQRDEKVIKKLIKIAKILSKYEYINGENIYRETEQKLPEYKKIQYKVVYLDRSSNTFTQEFPKDVELDT